MLHAELRRRFPEAKSLSDQLSQYACVAAILRGTTLADLEVGYVRRALQQQDRWSGQIAFPGGRAEPGDVDALMTARRETREEIGLELPVSALVGRLNDVQARRAGQMLDFYIRPFIFLYNEVFQPVLDLREIADFFWVPVRDLRDEKRQLQYELAREQMTMKLPAIQMPSDPPLWGLTYMMTQELLGKLA